MRSFFYIYKMKTVIKLFLTAILVYLLATYLLPGVHVNGFPSAIIVAVVLSLLNIFVKPVLIFLTLPATLVTFGLFLLVINAFVILICDYLLDNFKVDGFWYALLFSLILSFFQTLLFTFADRRENI